HTIGHTGHTVIRQIGRPSRRTNQRAARQRFTARPHTDLVTARRHRCVRRRITTLAMTTDITERRAGVHPAAYRYRHRRRMPVHTVTPRIAQPHRHLRRHTGHTIGHTGHTVIR